VEYLSNVKTIDYYKINMLSTEGCLRPTEGCLRPTEGCLRPTEGCLRPTKGYLLSTESEKTFATRTKERSDDIKNDDIDFFNDPNMLMHDDFITKTFSSVPIMELEQSLSVDTFPEKNIRYCELKTFAPDVDVDNNDNNPDDNPDNNPDNNPDVEKIIKELSLPDIHKAIRLCKERRDKLEKTELETSLIKYLLNRFIKYPCFMDFTKSIKINDFTRETIHGATYFKFSIEMCKMGVNCNNPECTHLWIFCEATSGYGDYALEYLKYHITQKKNFKQMYPENSSVSFNTFADYMEHFEMCSSAIKEITKKFKFDKDKIIVKKKILFMNVNSHNVLEFFFQDICWYIFQHVGMHMSEYQKLEILPNITIQ
jgi:hypothetical protein